MCTQVTSCWKDTSQPQVNACRHFKCAGLYRVKQLGSCKPHCDHEAPAWARAPALEDMKVVEQSDPPSKGRLLWEGTCKPAATLANK